MILVTGGAGYIGSHTVLALDRAGFEPVIFDDFSTGHRDFVGDHPLVEGNLRSASDIQEVFSRFPITGVIHFAAKALVGESMEHPELYYENNVVGGGNLLEAMRQAEVRPVIFSSTCATYGIPETDLLSETHPQRPINPYGATKLAFEQALEEFRQRYGLEYLALRYFNAAGADPTGSRGEDHSPETHLIPLVLEAAAGLRPEVRIYGVDYPTPDGTCIRDYIHVTDLAAAHVEGIKRLIDGTIVSQPLNLGTGQGASVREVIAAARRVTGREFKVLETERREGDPPKLVAIADRARSRLGWVPEHSHIDEIMTTAWRWLQRRRSLQLGVQ